MKKYTITFVDSQGQRVMWAQNTAKNLFDTQAQAEQRLKDIKENNSADTLKQVFGPDPKWKVLPVETFPNGDAVRTVFDVT